MRCDSLRARRASNRHSSTRVAFSEKIATLTPAPSHVAPSGYGRSRLEVALGESRSPALPPKPREAAEAGAKQSDKPRSAASRPKLATRRPIRAFQHHDCFSIGFAFNVHHSKRMSQIGTHSLGISEHVPWIVDASDSPRDGGPLVCPIPKYLQRSVANHGAVRYPRIGIVRFSD